MLVFGIFLQGCDNLHDSEITESSSGRYSTPYADAELLEQLATKEGAVDWRVARFFALTDMLDFTEENNWYGAELSRYPLVIYHTGNDEPRYYEFRVLRNDIEIGAIACAAEKAKASPCSM
jgi:hypothetical protein